MSEVITAGTADLILTHEDGSITVVDWKTGQPDKVDPPDDNLQLLAYGLAAAMQRSAPKFRVGLYFTEYPPLRLSRWFTDGADYMAVLSQIKEAAPRDRDTPIDGPHCDRCYNRKMCPKWAMAAVDAEGLVARFDPRELTKGEQVGRLVLGIKALKERLEVMDAHCKDFARRNRVEVDGKVYAPVMVNGRRSISIDKVEEAGLLEQLERAGCVSGGGMYERFGWKNAAAAKKPEKGGSSDWQDEMRRK